MFQSKSVKPRQLTDIKFELQGAEPVGTVESSEESSEDECGGVEMRPRAGAQGQQVTLLVLCPKPKTPNMSKIHILFIGFMSHFITPAD